MANQTGCDFSDHLVSLENKYQQALKDLYKNLTPIQRLKVARHSNQPTFLYHVFRQVLTHLSSNCETKHDPQILSNGKPGADADLKSDGLGQGEAIAHNLRTMFGLNVPFISIVIGEGGSGCALAISCANKLLMLEKAVFYVASPEACAEIPWNTAKNCTAPEKLKVTASELCELHIADGIIPVPLGAAHADQLWTSLQIEKAIDEAMDASAASTNEKL